MAPNQPIEGYTLDQYQKDSRRSYRYIAVEGDLVYPALGLANEAGEYLGKLKKVFRDDYGVIDEAKRGELAGELGDVLWYLAQSCTNLGYSLEQIAEMNIEKLHRRIANGTLGGSGDSR